MLNSKSCDSTKVSKILWFKIRPELCIFNEFSDSIFSKTKPPMFIVEGNN